MSRLDGNDGEDETQIKPINQGTVNPLYTQEYVDALREELEELKHKYEVGGDAYADISGIALEEYKRAQKLEAACAEYRTVLTNVVEDRDWQLAEEILSSQDAGKKVLAVVAAARLHQCMLGPDECSVCITLAALDGDK